MCEHKLHHDFDKWWNNGKLKAKIWIKQAACSMKNITRWNIIWKLNDKSLHHTVKMLIRCYLKEFRGCLPYISCKWGNFCKFSILHFNFKWSGNCGIWVITWKYVVNDGKVVVIYLLSPFRGQRSGSGAGTCVASCSEALQQNRHLLSYSSHELCKKCTK